MGRPRKHGTTLPPYLYLRRGKYSLELPGSKAVGLGSDLFRALAEYGQRSPDQEGMPALLEQAFPYITAEVSPGTKSNYRTQVDRLKRVFAKARPEQIRGRHIAALKLDMANTPNVFNQALSVLRGTFAYAVEQQLLDDNPAAAIKRYPEQDRERLIAFPEFMAIYRKSDPTMRCLMALMFLTGQRVNDVISIRLSQITDEGIQFRQQKTDKRLTVAWSPQLRKTVNRAKRLHGDVTAMALLLNARRRPLREGVARERWDIACEAANVTDAQMRDLRAMSATASQNPTELLGHSSRRTTERYLRGKQVPVVEGPSFVKVLYFDQKQRKVAD